MLTAVAVVALMGTTAASGHGASPTKPVSCGDQILTDTVLTTDLDCPADGLTIAASNVTLNLNGHSIRGHHAGSGVSFDASPTGAVVENGVIRGFSTGILSGAARVQSFTTNLVVENMVVVGNGEGIHLAWGGNPLIEASTIRGNDGAGIVLSDGSGVRGAVVTQDRVLDNGGDGITVRYASDASSYTDNLIQGNGGTGLAIREATSTITGNRVTANAGDGISIADGTQYGPWYLVAANVADRNGRFGISVCLGGQVVPDGTCGPGVRDDGNNAANLNDGPTQCNNITCARNPGLAKTSSLVDPPYGLRQLQPQAPIG